MKRATIRAILIDADRQTVEEFEMDPEDWRAITRALGCEMMTIGASLPNRDDLFVDDEGWLTGKAHGFSIAGNVFAGSGVVLGHDDEGGSANARSSVAALARVVEWEELTEDMRHRALSSSFIVTA